MRRQPPKVPRPEPVARAESPTLAALAADATPAAVRAFWSGPAARLPLVEDVPGGSGEEVLVSFCWRDADAEQVLLFANRLTDETRLEDSLLTRIPGTDVWHVTYRLRADWRASYCFLPQAPGQRPAWLGEDDQVAIRAALDRGLADPRNPDVCHNRLGVAQSVASLPAAPPQPWLVRRGDVAPGPLEETRLPDGRRAWLHDPAAAGTDEELPALVVLDGEVWAGQQDLPASLDNLHAEGWVRGWRTVFVESGGREQRWAELAADGNGVELVVDTVLPWLRARRAVLAGPRHVTVAGQSLGGLTALRAGLLAPEAVGNVVSHSASLWQDDLLDAVARHRPATEPLRVHLAHGAQEWVLGPHHRTLAEAMTARGIALDVAVHNGGHDYAWWRGGIADGLLAVRGIGAAYLRPA